MKIACLQFRSVFMDVERNIEKASQLLIRFKPGNLDLLVLPEMAFTGYMFDNREEIEPFLEDKTAGLTVSWAKTQAIRLKCYVLVGYPERGSKEEAYNSASLINRVGGLVLNYRKTFLFATDLTWATPGPGFQVVRSKEFGRVGVGICMDLNYDLDVPPLTYTEDCQFARFHRRRNADLVIVPMNWLLQDEQFTELGNSDKFEPSWSNLNYWMRRMAPIYEGEHKPVIFIACNRVGMERETTFCGSSCVVRLKQSKLELHGVLGHNEENVLVVDIDVLEEPAAPS